MKLLKKLLIIICIVSLFAALFILNASAANLAYGAGTVNCTDLNVRAEANLKSSVIITLSRRDIVVILEKTNATWYHINFKGTEGYVSAQYLNEIVTAQNFAAYGTIVGSDVNMRSTHATSGSALGVFQAGTVMSVIGINEGWYKVKYQNLTGYIRSDFMKIVTDSKSGGQKAGGSPSAPAPTTLGDKIVTLALKYNGYDYVYGGESPSEGFDCSGFTYYIMGQLGHGISRTASQQYLRDGKSVSRSALAPGDLLFFSTDGSGEVSHVGIYIGNNKFINAQNHNAGVTIASLDSDYWSETYYAAKRVS